MDCPELLQNTILTLVGGAFLYVIYKIVTKKSNPSGGAGGAGGGASGGNPPSDDDIGDLRPK